MNSITTPAGTIVTLQPDAMGGTGIFLENQKAPGGFKFVKAGTVTSSGLQFVRDAQWAAGPAVLRAMADLVEEHLS